MNKSRIMLERVANPRLNMYPFVVINNEGVCGKIESIDGNECTVKHTSGEVIIPLDKLTIPYVLDEQSNKVYLTIPWRLNLKPEDITKEVSWKIGEGKRSEGKAVRVLSALTYYSPSKQQYVQYGSHTRDFEITLEIVNSLESEALTLDPRTPVDVEVTVVSHQIL